MPVSVKIHSHLQSSKEVLDQKEAWRQAELFFGQPPAVTNTSTQNLHSGPLC